jgi:hypothetical protein
MKDCYMQHHRVCPRGNGFDRTLSDTILVMSTNTGKGDLLPFICYIFLELDRGERCVICFECPNLNSELCCSFLKRIISLQRPPQHKETPDGGDV